MVDRFKFASVWNGGSRFAEGQTYVCASDYDAAEARIRDLETAQTWQPIDTCPSDVCLLLYSPHLNAVNLERVESCVYHNTRAGSRHAWATHWMPLPPTPCSAPSDATAASREGGHE